jgi:uncharacterized membrane protein
MIVLAATGFLFGWPLSHPLNGFPLLAHVGFGLLYALALLGYAVLRKGKTDVWFWLLLLGGIVLILSILLAMFPLWGTQGQHAAIVAHRIAAAVSVIAALMGSITANRKK